jgi:hypothetical protein
VLEYWEQMKKEEEQKKLKETEKLTGNKEGKAGNA